jgi:hypothetical protein
MRVCINSVHWFNKENNSATSLLIPESNLFGYPAPERRPIESRMKIDPGRHGGSRIEEALCAPKDLNTLTKNNHVQFNGHLTHWLLNFCKVLARRLQLLLQVLDLRSVVLQDLSSG